MLHPAPALAFPVGGMPRRARAHGLRPQQGLNQGTRVARLAALLVALLALVVLAVLPAPLAAQRASGGGLVVPAGDTVAHDVVLVRGNVEVLGTVRGSVVAITGDVTVRPGGHVTGDVSSVAGTARNLGGRVDGDVGTFGERGATAPPPPRAPLAGVLVSIAWAALLLLVGVGILVQASPYLDGVAATLEAGVGRALLAGLGGQLLILPGLLGIAVALAASIVGVVLVPVAVVAYVAVVAGLLALGFIAVAFAVGRAVGGGAGARVRAAAARSDAVRALAIGLAGFLALWTLAALAGGLSGLGVAMRAAAAGVTWVALTAGFGAALLSRAGTRNRTRQSAARGATGTVPTDRGGVPVWQTPTPITGIVAARRPTPTAASGAELP